jgi:hypothetical protein
MSRSYIKEIFLEQWDDYQLSSISFEHGGNKNFFNFIKEYNIQSLPIEEKYKHKATLYYQRKHQAKLEGREFTEI